MCLLISLWPHTCSESLTVFICSWAGISQSIPVGCELFQSVMRAAVMRVDVRRAMHSDTIHEAYKRFSILHLNTFWLKTLVKLQAPNIIWFYWSLWNAIALVGLLFVFSRKMRGSTFQDMVMAIILHKKVFPLHFFVQTPTLSKRSPFTWIHKNG